MNSSSIKLLDCFGVDGFVESDISLLLNWAHQVCHFGQKIHNQVG